MKYLFGPVNSRRLGLSLGIDLVPFKTCTLNCVYCECGRTTNLTGMTDEFVPVREVIKELDTFLAGKPALDVLTFSGSGEPTLHSGIGTVIDHIKEKYPQYPVAVLTNGTLLWKREVRNALLRADTVIPSLDAVSDEVFMKINRPAPGLDAGMAVSGIIDFSREFEGTLIIEVFIVPGVNDTPEELSKIKEACLKIGPALVQLNRLDRPGTEPGISTADDAAMKEIARFFYPLNVEPVGRPRKMEGNASYDDARKMILATLSRRPSTADDLEATLGLRKVEVLKLLDALKKEGLVQSEEMERGIFYRAVDGY